MICIINVQPIDRIALSVEGAGIFVGFISDGRPFFVVQVDAARQHGTGAGVLGLTVGTIDNVPEPFQSRGGADLIGFFRSAAAGGKRGVAGDPAIKGAAGDGALVGHLAVKRAAGDGAVLAVSHCAVKRAAADGAADNEHGVRCSNGGCAAGDFYTAANIEIAGSFDSAAVRDTAATACYCLAATNLRIAGQGGGSVIADAAAHSKAFIRRCLAVLNTAAGHVERVPISDVHAAAHSHGVIRCRCRAVHNAAAGHDKRARTDIHAAALCRITVLDGAARHGERAATYPDTAAGIVATAV